MQAVDPTFAFGEDIQPPAARSSAAGPSQRWSQTSLPKHSFSRPQSSARQTAQPQEGHDELKSGEPNRPRSRRSAVNRESDQYDAPPEEHMSRSGHEPSFQPQYLQRQTQMRYSMPPEVYPTGMMQDHLFTPHQVYAPPVQYVQPYMSPYIQPSFARAGHGASTALLISSLCMHSLLIRSRRSNRNHNPRSRSSHNWKRSRNSLHQYKSLP